MVTEKVLFAPDSKVMAGGLTSMAISGDILLASVYVSAPATFLTVLTTVWVPLRLEMVIEGVLRSTGCLKLEIQVLVVILRISCGSIPGREHRNLT